MTRAKVKRFCVTDPVWAKADDARRKAEEAGLYVPADDGELCRMLLMRGIASLMDEVQR